MSSHRLVWLFHLVLLASSDGKVADGEGDGGNENDCQVNMDGTCVASFPTDAPSPAVDEHQCGVYMAPSTLGESTSMGIFTGVPLSAGDLVNFPEIVVPLLFREWGEHTYGVLDGELWDRYIWEGNIVDVESYTETNRLDTRAGFIPGIGCTVNSVLDANNIESTHGSQYDLAGLHRSKDPGSGAFTPYHHTNTTATTDIAPGAELFASYGDYWIPDIPGAQVTFHDDMDAADDFLIDEYRAFIQSHEKEWTPGMLESMWEFLTSDLPVQSMPSWPKTNLPRATWSEVHPILEAKIAERKLKEEEASHEPEADDESDEESDKLYNDKELKEKEENSVVRHFIRQQSSRSLEWLEKNGYCQDHIRPGRSTIEQAGRGAFANRPLKQGMVIGYAPLVHIGIHGREMFDIEYNDEARTGLPFVRSDEERDTSGNTRHMYDLILNYSFGHANSSVLLTPYGGMVNYINHDRERANVKVRWPDKELTAHKPEYLTKSPKDLANILDKIGLSFEYVALRDIEVGEEIFMDYGSKWEDAWDKHVANWKPLENSSSYVHSSELKEDHFRTKEERESNPYPSNLVTMCRDSFTVVDGRYEWVKPLLKKGKERVYCEVLERQESDPVLYTVEVEVSNGDKVVVHGVEETAIYLYDRSFSNDWHMPNVFRHEIMIPDDVLPDVWRNGPPIHPNGLGQF